MRSYKFIASQRGKLNTFSTKLESPPNDSPTPIQQSNVNTKSAEGDNSNSKISSVDERKLKKEVDVVKPFDVMTCARILRLWGYIVFFEDERMNDNQSHLSDVVIGK